MNNDRSLRRWVPTLVLILLVPVMAAAKCQQGSGGTSQTACNLLENQPPKWVAGRGKGTITASVTAYCDPRPKTHSLSVWLEHEGSDGKSFFQVGQTALYDKVTDMPPPAGRVYPVSVQCSDGNWRVRARAEGVSAAGNHFDFPLPVRESLIGVIRCRLQ
jgi:hypothetical protein